MTSLIVNSPSVIASYTLLVTCAMSRNDIVLLAWGSRSMSSVGLPRSARAAARLMAVVVLPTPPFWFAMATIIRVTTNVGIVAGNSGIAGLENGDVPI